MKKCNFVLSVEFNNGSVSELYNVLGLKVATIEQAKEAAIKMVDEYVKINCSISEYYARHWNGAKPHSMRYDIIDNNNMFKGREVCIFK